LLAKVLSLPRSQQAADQTGAVFSDFVRVVGGEAVEASDLWGLIASGKDDEGFSADVAFEQVRVLGAGHVGFSLCLYHQSPSMPVCCSVKRI
jgi:hypothetical protein